MSRFILLSASLIMTSQLPAQSHFTEAEEIRLALSAAPSAVSEGATVLVLREGKYEIAVQGSTDVTCVVSRSRPESLEPICYDIEATRTILPIDVRRVEMRLAGYSEDAIDAEIASRIGRGEFLLPSRPAMSYMMSAGQVLIAPDGSNAGSWYPHLMLYIPYLTADQLGLSGPPNMEAAAVFDEGLPTAHLVIAVREFVEP